MSAKTRRFVLLASLLTLFSPSKADAGAFVFSGESNGVNVIAHPEGYSGAGGVVNVSVCIDPNSANAAAMVNPVQTSVATWNALAAMSPNILPGAANDVPVGQSDFESAAHGHAVYRCNDGFAQVEATRQSRKAAWHGHTLTAFCLITKIVAGAEATPAPGDDRDPHVVVGGEIVEHIAEFGVRWRVQGV